MRIVMVLTSVVAAVILGFGAAATASPPAERVPAEQVVVPYQRPLPDAEPHNRTVRDLALTGIVMLVGFVAWDRIRHLSR